MLAALLVTLIAGFIVTSWQWSRAARANEELRASIAHLEWRRVVQLLESGDSSVGVAQLARLLRAEPGNPRVASLALSVLEQRGFATPAAPALDHGAGFVTHARLSPDGARIVTAGSDGTARLWDAATSRPLAPPMVHGGSVRWVEFSPDGRRIVTASEDHTVRFWDGRTGAPLGQPLAHAGPVLMAQFAGARLATISEDGTARLWPEAGEPLALVLGAPGRTLAWSQDGTRLFTASTEGIKAWSLEGHELFSSEASVDGLIPSPDGTRLAGWSGRGLRVWDAATGVDTGVKFEEAGSLQDAAWSPDGTRLAGAAVNAWARIWDAATGRAITPRLEHLYRCSAVAFSPDGRMLFSGGADGSVRRWETTRGRRMGATLDLPSAVMGLGVSLDGTHLLVIARPWNSSTPARGGIAQLWDLRPPGEHPWVYRDGKTTSAIAWSSDGRRYATGSVSGSVVVHEVATGTSTVLTTVADGWIRGLAFLDDDRKLGYATNGGTFGVWSLEQGNAAIGPLRLGPIESAHFFANGTRLLTGLNSGEVILWDLSPGVAADASQKSRILLRLPSHRTALNDVAISPDSRAIASAGEDGQCLVSDAATGQLLFPPIQSVDEIVSAQFSADSRWLVTASHDRTARIWDARTGAPHGPPLRHDGEVAYAEFSPDGTRVLTADRTGAARLWSVATGVPLTEPLRHATALRSATFSPDGLRVVTEDHEGLRLWETATGEPLTLLQPHPASLGIGFHSQGMQARFSPDGRKVLHGCATSDVILWSFPVPPVPAPAWLPDLLEAIASLSVTDGNALTVVPSTRWLALRDRLRVLPGEDFYSRWGRQYCRDVSR